MKTRLMAPGVAPEPTPTEATPKPDASPRAAMRTWATAFQHEGSAEI
jgi:hypothetical protein